MIEAPYQDISFDETVLCLQDARQRLRELAREARGYFIDSWRANSAQSHQQMNTLVEEAFTLAHQTIDALPDDILKITSDQSMRMGTFYHTRGGMPPRECEIFTYLGGASYDFRTRKGYAERNIERARKAIAPYIGDESVTWEQRKAHDEPLYMNRPTPLETINHIGDEFYVLTLILNKVPGYLRQSHEMMLRKFKSGL